MPRYRYTARDASGRSASAEITADSRKDALRALSARGLQVAGMEETAAGPAANKATRPDRGAGSSTFRATGSFTRGEFLPFLVALAELTGSGMSPGEAVRLLAQRLREARLRSLAAALWERLSEGKTLSQAMAGLPAVFDTQCISLIHAAEATGSLDDVLARLIAHHTERRELRQRLVTALIYPVVVCIVAFGVIVFFVTFLLPRLQGLLSSLGSKLPLSTQLLVGAARALVDYGIVIFPLLAFGGLALWRWRKTEAGRTAIDGWLVRFPGVSRLTVDAAVLDFTSTLAVLLENGINTVEALRLTERTVGNRSVRAALREATDRVLEGDSLSAALSRTGFVPPLVTDRIAVGESTGKLAPCLRDVSRQYAAQHSRRLHWLTGVVSSAVLGFAFFFVAFLAYAIVSAVLQVSAGFKF